MFGQILLERNPRVQPDNHGPFTLIRNVYVCMIKGKASVQDEKSLRQERNMPVQLVRKAKTDYRSVLGRIKN